MKFILAAVMALMVTGCDGFNNYDERTVCTEMANGDVVCTTKYNDNGLITCQHFEDASQSCIADNMTLDEVVAIYDAPDAVIDVTDNEVLVEIANNMIIIEMQGA